MIYILAAVLVLAVAALLMSLLYVQKMQKILHLVNPYKAGKY